MKQKMAQSLKKLKISTHPSKSRCLPSFTHTKTFLGDSPNLVRSASQWLEPKLRSQRCRVRYMTIYIPFPFLVHHRRYLDQPTAEFPMEDKFNPLLLVKIQPRRLRCTHPALSYTV